MKSFFGSHHQSRSSLIDYGHKSDISRLTDSERARHIILRSWNIFLNKLKSCEDKTSKIMLSLHRLSCMVFYCIGFVLHQLPCMALYCIGVRCSNPNGGTSQYLYGFLLRRPDVFDEDSFGDRLHVMIAQQKLQN